MATKTKPARKAPNTRRFEETYNQGLVALRERRLDEALAIFQKACDDYPGNALLHTNVGVTLQELGRLEDAVAAHRRAIAIDPGFTDAYTNLGSSLTRLDRCGEAVEVLERAVGLKPTAITWLNMNAALSGLGRTAEALAAVEQAVRLQPDMALAHYNIGNLQLEMNRPDAAIIALRRAIEIQPDFAEAHFKLAHALLISGDYEAGWEEYQWRGRLSPHSWIRDYCGDPSRLWKGESLAGRTLLLVAEQGLGDTLQFMRYIPHVVAMGGTVVLSVQPAVKYLLGVVEGVTLIALDQKAPPFDYYCMLMSLPYMLRDRLKTIPTDIPYLAAEDDVVATWRARLGGEGFKVGIVWQGKPGTIVDRGRSVALASFAPLAAIPGVRLISLQKNAGAEQLASLPPGMSVETLGDDFDGGPAAFRDTAAVMMGLDLVVTTDTAIAHLAGGLGVPTWVVLKYAPDWRWEMGSDTTKWYPTMRLFRQTEPNDWDGVFTRLAAALQNVAARREALPDLRGTRPVKRVEPRSLPPSAGGQSRFETFLHGQPRPPQPEWNESRALLARQVTGALSARPDLPKGGAVLDLEGGASEVVALFRAAGYNARAAAPAHPLYVEAGDASQDLVWCSRTLEYSAAPLFTLAEIRRVLRPHGLVYAEVPAAGAISRHEDKAAVLTVCAKAQWAKLFGRAGFAVLTDFDIRPAAENTPDYYGFLLKAG